MLSCLVFVKDKQSGKPWKFYPSKLTAHIVNHTYVDMCIMLVLMYCSYVFTELYINTATEHMYVYVYCTYNLHIKYVHIYVCSVAVYVLYIICLYINTAIEHKCIQVYSKCIKIRPVA